MQLDQYRCVQCDGRAPLQAGSGNPLAQQHLSTFNIYIPPSIFSPARWVHMDTGAYNTSTRDGRPEGGEALGLRALWHFLKGRYGTARGPGGYPAM